MKELPQAVGGKKQVLDFISGPDAEGSPATRGSIAVGAEDARRTNRFLELLMLGIAPQKTVFDEATRFLAMRTGSDFKLGQ